uniref:Vacuolar ATPase assembly protein VMA22 n=1 Tax=Zosterops lateralis melanops TaxID=1220523 RepID=A0A8D2PM72_ZOSLA
SPPGSLSLSLDEAALEVMEALELLRERRERLEQHLRQGWLSLAQARYSLGCHRVSSLQYGATMVPRVRVCHRWGHGDTGETLEGTLGQWEGRWDTGDSLGEVTGTQEMTSGTPLGRNDIGDTLGEVTGTLGGTVGTHWGRSQGHREGHEDIGDTQWEVTGTPGGT